MAPVRGTDCSDRRSMTRSGQPIVDRGADPPTLDRRLTRAEKQQLFAEWRHVGLLLGVKDNHMPQRYEDLREYVDTVQRTAPTASSGAARPGPSPS